MEKKELPPISFTREGIRLTASAFVAIIGALFSLYFFFDDRWVHRDTSTKEQEEVDRRIIKVAEELAKKINEVDAKALKQAYFLRMATLRDQISHLRMKRKIFPDQFTPVDAVTLESLEDQFQQIDRMYNTEQLKPK